LSLNQILQRQQQHKLNITISTTKFNKQCKTTKLNTNKIMDQPNKIIIWSINASHDFFVDPETKYQTFHKYHENINLTKEASNSIGSFELY